MIKHNNKPCQVNIIKKPQQNSHKSHAQIFITNPIFQLEMKT
jgi:hypothetical protein